ncbi:MAG TPA: hypothetical protein VNA25_01350 [Phycisphaerae bacterium]|nr:hypothetical protein [Phycisphaerae bacterium]
MTCEACCREFQPNGRSKYCPHCGFNNGRGWWPRRDDKPARAKTARQESYSKKAHEKQMHAA